MGLEDWETCTHCYLGKLDQSVSDREEELASATGVSILGCANRLAQAEASLEKASANATDADWNVCRGEEVERYLHLFAEGPQQWNKFDDTDKSSLVDLSNEQKTAESKYALGTVRVGPWVPRDGYATGTVRVDQVGRLQIGVITTGYADGLNNQPLHGPWMPNMDANAKSCHFYTNDHAVNGTDKAPSGMFEVAGTKYYGFPKISNGSEVTVTLKGGNVIFTIDGLKLITISIPEGCGPISLAVSLFGGTTPAKVTLLTPRH